MKAPGEPRAARTARGALARTLTGVALLAGGAARADAPLVARADALVAREGLAPTPGSAERRLLRAPIPAAPYRIDDVRLAGSPHFNTSPGHARDGSLLLTSDAPQAVWWLGLDGAVRQRVSLSERGSEVPTGTPSEGLDGRVYTPTQTRALLLAAPDGTVRQRWLGAGPLNRGPLVLANGDALAIYAGGTEAQWLSPELEPVRAAPLPGRLVNDPQPDGRGCVWLATQSATGCLSEAGVFRALPGAAGARAVVAVDARTVLVEVEGEAQLRDARTGSVRGRFLTGGPAVLVSPLAGRGAVVVRMGPPAELVVLGLDGAVVARAPLPNAGVNAVLADANGALLVLMNSGLVLALEADGAPRWTLSLPAASTRAPLPLPDGGLALVTAAGGLVLLRP